MSAPEWGPGFMGDIVVRDGVAPAVRGVARYRYPDMAIRPHHTRPSNEEGK